MVSYPIGAPPSVPSNIRLTLRHQQTAHRSPFTGHASIVDSYAEWMLELGFSAHTKAQANALIAWVDSLRGSVGTFLYSPHGEGRAIMGVTLSGSAFAYSDTIAVAGFASPPTGLVGQLISIDNRLHRITAYSPGTIEIAPALRADKASGMPVNFANPTGNFRLGGEAMIGISRDSDASYPDAITAMEAL